MPGGWTVAVPGHEPDVRLEVPRAGEGGVDDGLLDGELLLGELQGVLERGGRPSFPEGVNGEVPERVVPEPGPLGRQGGRVAGLVERLGGRTAVDPHDGDPLARPDHGWVTRPLVGGERGMSSCDLEVRQYGRTVERVLL